MKIKSFVLFILYTTIITFAKAQTADSVVTKNKRVIKHAFYTKGDWYLSTGVYAQTVLNTFSASTLQYTSPRASYFHESNQMAFIPLVGIRYMMSDRWGIHYLPAIRKTMLQDTLTTGTLLGSIMEHGQWIVDHHFEATWFTKPAMDMQNNSRAYLGAGLFYTQQRLSL